jgi:hypothetical protein
MFRRRTDQVYATLQQVQRRITEQTGAGAPNLLDGKPPISPALSPLRDALPAQNSPKMVFGGTAETPGYPLPPQNFQGNRFVLPLSGQFAVTLIVLWIASCVLCFVLGQHERDRRTPNPGTGYAEGPAGNRPPPTPEVAEQTKAPVKPLGDYLLILTSVPSANGETERSYQDRASQLNDIMLKNSAKRGWKPYFGVRRPSSGGLQLVFGQVGEGVYGINRQEFDDFARMMAQPPPKGGGYASASWVKLF